MRAFRCTTFLTQSFKFPQEYDPRAFQNGPNLGARQGLSQESQRWLCPRARLLPRVSLRTECREHNISPAGKQRAMMERLSMHQFQTFVTRTDELNSFYHDTKLFWPTQFLYVPLEHGLSRFDTIHRLLTSVDLSVHEPNFEFWIRFFDLRWTRFSVFL